MSDGLELKRYVRQRIIPVNGRVILEPANIEQVTRSGIVLPGEAFDADKERPEVGVILRVDLDDDHKLNDRLAIGVKILFNRNAAIIIQRKSEGDKKYIVIMKDNILGIYEDVGDDDDDNVRKDGEIQEIPRGDMPPIEPTEEDANISRPL